MTAAGHVECASDLKAYRAANKRSKRSHHDLAKTLSKRGGQQFYILTQDHIYVSFEPESYSPKGEADRDLHVNRTWPLALSLDLLFPPTEGTPRPLSVSGTRWAELGGVRNYLGGADFCPLPQSDNSQIWTVNSA